MQINELAKKLRLPYTRENAGRLIDEARHLGMDYEQFLAGLLQREYEERNSHSIQRKIRDARFPYQKTIEHYQVEHLSMDLKRSINELITLSFVNNKENVILIGNPGVGKTHLAIGLGIACCLQGMNVLFVHVPNLVIELKEAMSKHQINMYKKKFERYDLVILDELGYISFDREGSEILFNLLSNRNDRGATIITTNLTFDKWEDIFKDPILTGAIVDRLGHKSHVLDLSGESYRIKETIEWMNG